MKTYGTFVASSLLAALALMPSAADAAQGDGHWYATGTLGAAFSSSQTLDYSSPAGAASDMERPVKYNSASLMG